MRTLTRYVLIEMLKVFLVTLTGMTLLMMLVGIAQEALKQGLGIGPVLRLLPYLLPNALRFAIPGTILFAACSVYGRMAGGNEIIVVKSLGLSPMVMIWPAIWLSIAVSFVAVWMNDVAVTWGMRGVQRVVISSVEEIAYGMLRTQRSYATKRFSINVKRVDGRELIRPTISFQGTGDSPPVTLTAERAELRSKPEENTLSIFLTNGTIQIGDDVTVSFRDTIERVVPLTDAAKKGDQASGPANVPLGDLSGEVKGQEKRIENLRQQLAAEATYELLTGDFHGLRRDQWAGRQDELNSSNQRMYRLMTEPWRRWATGFSCLCFVLVGAPMAVRMRNSDFLTSFGTCFVPILLIYYPLFALGVDRAKNGSFPPYSVWLGNVILALMGLYLLRKVVRY